MQPHEIELLRNAVRNIPDFPKPGILFRDITPLLLEPALFRLIISELSRQAREAGAQKIAGIDARGFLFGATVAYELGVGFIPIRKKGKLPAATYSQAYSLEYGEAEIELHRDALSPGDKVALVDDLLATGGTAAAALALIRKGGAQPVLAQFVIELAALKGREPLAGCPVTSILVY